MKALRPLTTVSLVLVSTGVLAAPPVVNPGGIVLKPGMVAQKPSDPEVTRAKSHVFKPANISQMTAEDQRENAAVAIVNRPKLQQVPQTPKLNVTKFGESVHAALKDNVRGYALGLRKKDQHILTLIWDFARTPQDGNKGWNLDTRMHVASVSKLMTGIIATKALDEKGLNADTKINNYLPTYWNESATGANLSFRQLLTHNAGFTIYDGDYLSFKKQIEQGVSVGSPNALGYTNGSFSLVRVLVSTMTGAVNKNTKWDLPGNFPSATEAQFNDAVWDAKTQDAFMAYAQQKVFTPSGVSNVSSEPNANGAMAYAQKADTKGWNSGDVSGQLGGAGFRLSVNDVLSVMGTFRRKGSIVTPDKAKAAIEARLGIDQVIDTPAGKIYNKNGRWQTGPNPSDDTEQSVAYYLQEDMECVVLVNSWIGQSQASLRGTIKDAYIANLE